MWPNRPEAELLSALEQAWFPHPGRQAEAYRCEADILFYGGAAGGGKSDLLLGLAHTAHERSIIFRRQFVQLRGLEDRAQSMLSALGTYNAKDHVWRLNDGRVIEFGAVEQPSDVLKYQGRPHDFLGFDEITHFTESQFRFLGGWLRTTTPGQRQRIVAAGNPPTDPEGEWVVKFWAPWLDEQHPNPAEPGELRWFAVIDGKDVEVEDGKPFEFKGELVTPKSRTFIRALLSDNPLVEATGYRAQLQGLPEPLRSQMLLGDFGVGQEDNPWQVIPTAWVKAAQARWTEQPPGPIDALGVDVARGGKDRTVLTPRHGAWFGPQSIHPGSSTPDGPAVVRLIMEAVGMARPRVNVDVVGVGYAVEDTARQAGIEITPCNGAAGTDQRTRTGDLGFVNSRAAWYWSLREDLDPASGVDLALPPDRELLADLTAPRWKLATRGIQVESKESIKERIGRSPDKGDSLVYAHALERGGAQGWIDYYREAAELGTFPAPVVAPQQPAPQGPRTPNAPPAFTPSAEPKVLMLALPGITKLELMPEQVRYVVGEGRLFEADAQHVERLKGSGCKVAQEQR